MFFEEVCGWVSIWLLEQGKPTTVLKSKDGVTALAYKTKGVSRSC